jgi:hypothetical protein
MSKTGAIQEYVVKYKNKYPRINAYKNKKKPKSFDQSLIIMES